MIVEREEFAETQGLRIGAVLNAMLRSDAA
jgi:hypothetical protein